VAGQPAWVAAAGLCPTHDDHAATRWTQAARAVVAYRDQYGVKGADLLGDNPTQGTRARHRAIAVTGAQRRCSWVLPNRRPFVSGGRRGHQDREPDLRHQETHPETPMDG
jgi:hypothetical protein